MLRRSADRNPQKPAVVCGRQIVSYQALDRSSDALARWLLDQGLEPRDRVAIHWCSAWCPCRCGWPKLALYLAMRDQQLNNSELARRLGLHERVIRRMLDPAHATKAEKIQGALAVLGKQMTVEVHDGA